MKDLIERLERATGPDRELDADIAAAHYAVSRECFLTDELGRVEFGHQRKYTASLDAALTLVPEGWGLGLSGPHEGGWRCYLEHAHKPSVAAGFTPAAALAICIAALKARAAGVRD